MSVKPIPDGYSTVTPYLIVKGAANAIDYYKMAPSRIMLADESPQMGHKSPLTLGGSGTGLMLYVNDADDTFQRAISGGGTVVQPVKDQFYGDRSGNLTDPFGHQWTIATHVEDVTPEEMKRRMDEAMKAAPPAGS